MLAILAFLGWLLAGLLVVIVLAVAICLWSPVWFETSADLGVELAPEGAGGAVDQPPDAWARFGWRVRVLGGLVVVDETGVSLFGRRLGRKPGSEYPHGTERYGPRTTKDTERGELASGGQRAGKHRRRRRRERVRGRERRRGRKVDLATLRRLWPRARAALGRTWSMLHLRGRLHITLGLDDPATSGVLAGLGSAVRQLTAPMAGGEGGLDFRITPMFDRECAAAEIRLAGRATAMALISPWLRLALSKDGRRLWWPRRRTGPRE